MDVVMNVLKTVVVDVKLDVKKVVKKNVREAAILVVKMAVRIQAEVVQVEETTPPVVLHVRTHATQDVANNAIIHVAEPVATTVKGDVVSVA